MAASKTSVTEIYNHVIDDVIAKVADTFTDEGLEEHVLLQLKELWKSKLLNGSAAEPAAENKDSQGKEPEGMSIVTTSQVQTQNPGDEMIPILLTVPIQPTIGTLTRALIVNVPTNVVYNRQLQLQTESVLISTIGLPTQVATSLVQEHVNAILNQQQQQQFTINSIIMPQMNGSDEDAGAELVLSQVDGMNDTAESTLPQKSSASHIARKSSKRITVEFVRRVDGGTDTSDEEEDDSEDDTSEDDASEDEIDEDAESAEGASEEEPLNSEDDVSDEEPSELSIDNLVVCQFDKVMRNRNKWKFYLKGGIMNLDGEDFVFQKANGDAEW